MSTIKNGLVYGVGNALVDLQVQIEDDFLSQLDVPKSQMLLVDADRQQAVLKQLNDHNVNKCSGGSAANTMVGIAELGGKASYCGKVAEDDLGKFYLNDLNNLKINLFGNSEHDGRGQTGTSLVMITPDAQRTMLTNLGISAELNSDDIHKESIIEADYIYIEGYLFTGESTTQAALKAIEIAKENNVKVALTISDPFVIGICKDLFMDLIENSVDLLFCNEQEAQALTEIDDAIEAAKVLHKHVKNVVVTLGDKGAIIMHNNEVLSIAGQSVKAVDTTGAGDMFAAGILYGITNGLSWQQSGKIANHAAATVVAQLGARLNGKVSQEELKDITN